MMDQATLQHWVEANNFFQFMDSEERTHLYSFKDHWKFVKPGECVVRVGETDYGFFVIVKGTFSVIKPEDIFLAHLNPGDLFGEVSLKSRRKRYSNVVADEEGIVFKVDDILLKKISPALHLKIKNQVIEVLIRRLDDMNQRLVKLTRMR
ncbi:putative Cyclic nucleotide-binding protein [Nitrospina gracilis 3/211]|uniref:Putative Cyclic nucleotide-binding protein n=1 Tax=Nitrospina gracilis (strain 3/211) TaxID=1266370 RepID=M1YWX9_NITG3|nr:MULTISPECIES: cyclic nucleotide-binding domain-containing protein [Nitrospina]MCF8723115.1 CRP-like cAMP-binding protein [Nitrospina sp. Nb-3]CCQ90157.1 putative Cyclic nucleotide-binding protein [Nitrospina gracilis 3/211]